MQGDADLLSRPGRPADEPDHDGINRPGGETPHLELGGFSGTLAHLLFLARAQKLELAKLSLPDFVAQLADALRRDAAINQKADWLGMAAWIVLLRSRLLIPASPAVQLAAATEAQNLQARLLALQEMQALAAWLSARPQLGQDVFARGAPELLGTLSETDHQMDVIEFLWATIEVLDDAGDTDTAAPYRPFQRDLHTVADARARILRNVVEPAVRHPLQDLVPTAAGLDPADATALQKYKSGWTSTLTAALEMAKQGDVALIQESAFAAIAVTKAAGTASA